MFFAMLNYIALWLDGIQRVKQEERNSYLAPLSEHNTVAGQVIGPKEEPTFITLPNGHSINLIPKAYHYIH